MSIERVVTIATPLFAALAGLVTTVVGQAVPGVNLNKTDLTALFIAGVTAAAGAAIKWLHGRQKFVQFTGDVDKVVDLAVAKVKANAVAGPAVADIEGLLKAHTAEIVDAIGNAVHAPPSVEQIAKAMAQAAVGGSTTVPAASATPPASSAPSA